MPKQQGRWPQAPLLLERSPGWTSLLLEAAGRDRQAGQVKVVARPRIRIEMRPPPWGNDRPIQRRR